jgi:ATP-dependent RNA helicase RhlE
VRPTSNLHRVDGKYVHHIGRTARAGAKGTAVSFCDAPERDALRAIEKLTGAPLNVIDFVRWPRKLGLKAREVAAVPSARK